MSDDVKAAIASNWSFDKIGTVGASIRQDDLPTPDTAEVRKYSANSSKSMMQGKSSVQSPTSSSTLSRKPRFQPLRPRPLPMRTETMKTSENSGKVLKYGGNEAYSAGSDETHKVHAREVYSPTAWEKEALLISSTSNCKAKLKLPNRPGTPKTPGTLVNSNSRTDLPLSPGKNANMLPGSQFLVDQIPREEVGEPGQPAIRVDEDSILDSRSFRPSGIDASADQHHGTDPLDNKPSGTTPEETVLDSGPTIDFEDRHSSASYLGAVSHDEDAPINMVRPVTAAVGPRLRSPTQAIGEILGTRSSNINKRRMPSIFDFEEDFTGTAHRQGKKSTFDQVNVKRSGKPTLIDATFPRANPISEDIGSAGTRVEKALGQTGRANHVDDLYLPRV